MMSDSNPFLEGYKSQILGRPCPYDEGTADYARWCQGFGGAPVAKIAIKAVAVRKPDCHLSLSAEGRRPFVEGYKSAILAIRFGQNTVCPYEEGSPEYERWWKGFRGPVAAAVKKSISIPVLEGRRPFVEGYKSAILASRFGRKDTCPYDEGTSEYERWTKGFRGQIASKAMADMAARC